jgi:hypothetical protein
MTSRHTLIRFSINPLARLPTPLVPGSTLTSLGASDIVRSSSLELWGFLCIAHPHLAVRLPPSKLPFESQVAR